ncbi:MAG: hypothetical protein K6V73_09850 [Firmicutes bacterium]|nr:hypothetical protein [Bacillota bacterium]
MRAEGGQVALLLAALAAAALLAIAGALVYVVRLQQAAERATAVAQARAAAYAGFETAAACALGAYACAGSAASCPVPGDVRVTRRRVGGGIEIGSWAPVRLSPTASASAWYGYTGWAGSYRGAPVAYIWKAGIASPPSHPVSRPCARRPGRQRAHHWP